MQTAATYVENLFRHEYGKIVAALVHKFGTSHLELIEDAVQDALLKAMQIWAYKEAPKNPTAWLLKVSNNSLIDSLRKAKKMQYGDDVYQTFDNKEGANGNIEMNNIISDSQLKMIFACCHPNLSQEYQIVLSLKLIGGFSNKEIARAMLKKEGAVAKSFTRGKAKLKEQIKTLDIPLEMGLQSRLFVVLKVIYLLFSEGYAATSGANIIKRDFCYEAIRLALLLNENDYCKHPNLNALIGLMCFHSARFDARVDGNLDLITLENQDRNKYDRKLINIGVSHLELSETEDGIPSNYQLEAAVSYYHCIARTFAETDWESILTLYDIQLRRQYSPIVQLNRIIPFQQVHGSDGALRELEKYEKGKYFKESVLYYAIKAELKSKTNKLQEAKQLLEKAIDLNTNEMETKHLLKKLDKLTA